MLLQHVVTSCLRHSRRSYTSSAEIRATFLDYFINKHDHAHIPSSKVYSPSDPSLLFVNAGMNQFKPIFLGEQSPTVASAVNSQRCIRAGGKHNDLNDVGYDYTHHTFFEMLGSWSFNHYFKEEACMMAWDLLTNVYMLSKDRLYVTYFGGCPQYNLQPDHETREIWRSLGVPDDRILPFGTGDNFWEMGDTGPCGPCTEIHYDKLGEGRFAPHEVNVDGSDVVEIWNIVFTQYNRLPTKQLELLDKYYVDTGMGLERIVAVMQGKSSNYDTDLFLPIISTLEELCKDRPRYRGRIGDDVDMAYRVISDHIRMLTVAIADGIIPGSTERELITRKVLRRAVLNGMEHLNAPSGFLQQLVPIVVDSLLPTFPELSSQQSNIMKIIEENEQQYRHIIQSGDDTILTTPPQDGNVFPVKVATKLYYHQGYPLSRLLQKVTSHGSIIDGKELQDLRKHHLVNEGKDVSSNKDINDEIVTNLSINKIPPTNQIPFTLSYSSKRGQYKTSSMKCKVLAVCNSKGDIINQHHHHDTTTDSDDGYYLILDNSPLYPSKSAMKPLQLPGFVCVDDVTIPVDDVIYLQGWILHRVHCCPTMTGSDCVVTINTARWLPRLRAFKGMTYLRQRLRHHNEIVKSIVNGDDQFEMTLLGQIDDGVVRDEQQSLHDVLLNNDVPLKHEDAVEGEDYVRTHRPYLNMLKRDVEGLVVTKVKRRGVGRTIIQGCTGGKAVLALSTNQSCNQQYDSVRYRFDTVDRDSIDDVRELLQTVGKLTYEVNSAEIPHDNKQLLREQLRNMSANLNTTVKKLNKKS